MSEKPSTVPQKIQPEPPRDSIPVRRVLLLAGAVLVAIGLIFCGGGYWYLEREFDKPADVDNQENTLIRIKPGMGLSQVVGLLKKKNIISNPSIFRLQAWLRGGAGGIHVGVYEFSPSMSPRQVYLFLTGGKVAQRTFTIPEGLNLQEIAAIIERSGLAERNRVLALATDSDFISSLTIDAETLEGYLFPDTYRFPLGIKTREILRTMVENLKSKLDPSILQKMKQLDFSIHETLTLASIIEKETSVDEERPLIAAVFLNRLHRNMRLQSDPTVIYALPSFDGDLRRRDLFYKSPYNTYRNKGLPPGPIASPGFASIRAVLDPADVDYLYFVATRTGRHKFSKTYEEHKKAVAHFQLRKEVVDR